MNFCHDILQKRGGRTRRTARISSVSTIGGGGGQGGPANERYLLSANYEACIGQPIKLVYRIGQAGQAAAVTLFN